MRETEVALLAHDLAHRQLRDVGQAGHVLADRLGRLGPEVVHAAELVERVEPHEVLADRRVVDRAVALGQVDEELVRGAEHARRLRRRADGRPPWRRPGTKSPTRLPRSFTTVPGVAALAAAWPPPEPRPARSFISVVLATAQPLFSPPMSELSGVMASSRKTSLNMAWPVISTSGPDLDALLVHVDGEVGDALVLGHVGVGAGDEHARGRRPGRRRSTPSGR